ncbi:hypothetical protein [Streptomyces europaeiscabiei]|uniref:hypothetical protein n=1 Tax=Streptomyces europaeiscabiei TaxID=146819 RepID=UPI0038F7D2FD
MRAQDLCQALDLPIIAKNTEGIRSKLKRLVSRGILTEPEPGLFAQPHPKNPLRTLGQHTSPSRNRAPEIKSHIAL